MNTQAFTLVELLIAISIAFFLLFINIPCFHYFFIRNRSTIQVNAIVTALQFARSSAIKSRMRIKFCKSSDHKVCGGSWSNGQLVINSHNKVLRVLPSLCFGDQLIWQSNLGKNDFLEFLPLGTTNGQHGAFYYCPHEGKKYAKAIIVNQMGHMRVSDKRADGRNISCD